MKLPVIIGDKVPNILGLFMRIKGITLYPFIFLRPTATEVDINHEKIHIQQQQEIIITSLVIFSIANFIFHLVGWVWIPLAAYLMFYVLYFIGYLLGFVGQWIKGKLASVWVAYRNISFEKEAYENQSNMNYLKERRLFASFKYVFNKN